MLRPSPVWEVKDMSGLGVTELLILSILLVPVIVLIVGVVSLPVILTALFIKYKVLHHR